jgi:DnaJ-class molecular chaperone
MENNSSDISFNKLEFNLYELMNLPIDCTVEDVSKKFKKLIKKFHPDKITALEESLYYNITIANHILSDPKSKERYNNWLLKSNMNHSMLKQNFKEDSSSLQQIFPKNKKDAQIEFDKTSELLAQRHGNINLDNRNFSSLYKEKETNRKKIPEIVKENFNDMKDFNKKFQERKMNGIYCDKLVKHETSITPFNFTSTKSTKFTELKDTNNVYLKDSTIDYAFSLLHVNTINYDEEPSPKLTNKINEYNNATRNISNNFTLDDI